MKGLKNGMVIVALVALIVSLAACGTGTVQPMISAAASSQATATPKPSPPVETPVIALSPSPTAMTAPPLQTADLSTPKPTLSADTSGDDGDEDVTPPHYDIVDLAKLGISDAQYQKINAILYGFLNMSVEGSRMGFHYFSNAASISKQEQLCFAYRILNDDSHAIDMDTLSEGTIKSDIVVNIIRSAFNNHYQPSPQDNFDDLLVYKNGNFQFEGASGDPVNMASTYSITKISSEKLLIKFNIYLCSDAGNFYENKGEAIIERDSNSLFGYHFVSFSKGKESHIRFESAQASSYLPSSGKKNFSPLSALDGKYNTAWATKSGKGEWIMLKFDKPQELTGLSLYFGNWSDKYESDMNSNQPSRFRLDFSDGTSIIENNEDFSLNYPCIAFGKKIRTTFVKITILDTYTDTTAYLSEVSPI